MAFTFFFRDLQILDLIMEHTVPYMMGRSNVKVWDAGLRHGAGGLLPCHTVC